MICFLGLQINSVNLFFYQDTYFFKYIIIEFVLMLKYCIKYRRKRDAKYCVSTIII